MSAPLLFSEPPDLTADYWRCGNVNTALRVQENGVRVDLDHQARVLRARRVLDLTVGSEQGTGELADSNPATVPPFAGIEQPPPPR